MTGYYLIEVSMKKILLIVTTVFLVYTTYIFSLVYTENQLNQILQTHNEYNVVIKNNTQDNIVSSLIEICDEENVNIQKNVYKLKEDGTYIIDIYAYNSNPELFYKNLLLKKGSRLTNQDKNTYISSNPKDDCLDSFYLMDNENILRIYPFEAVDKESLQGVYFISGVKDEVQFETIKASMVKEGIVLNETSATPDSNFNMSLISYIPLLLLVVVLSIVYYFLLSYKEISILKLFGYSKKDIQKYKKSSINKQNLILFFVVYLIAIILHFVVFKQMDLRLYGFLFVFFMVLFVLLGLFLTISSYLITSIDLLDSLKNKKPFKLLSIINLLSKSAFCLIILVTAVGTKVNIDNANIENYNMKEWREAINYSYTVFQSSPTTENGNMYEIGLKCQELYKLLEDKGSILVKPNGYYMVDEVQKAEIDKISEKYISEYMEINQNYLDKYSVYDNEGKKISLDDIDPEDIWILVPEKYIDQMDQLKESYTQNYQQLRYYDQNLYNETQGIAPVEEVPNVNFMLIKNGQKFFTYDPNIKENNNYVTDPILVITTANNRGTDAYFSFLSGGNLITEISNPEEPFMELEPVITEAGLEQYITSTPTVFSRVDQKQYELEQQIQRNILILIISFISYLIISIFVAANYIESNKQNNFVYKLFGYSFLDRHKKILIQNVLLITVLSIVPAIQYKEIEFSFQLLGVGIVIDLFITFLALVVYERKSMAEVLKGS